MNFKIGSLGALGALLLGAQLLRGWQADSTAVAAAKTVVKTQPGASSFVDGVRVLSFAESQAERKREGVVEKKDETVARSKWVRILPGGKMPVPNGLTRNDKVWEIVPGQSRFGGTEIILGSGYQSRSVATLKHGKLEIECTPANATKNAKHSH